MYMSKMDSHDPFGFLKHKLWPKEGSGAKLAIWLPTTKSWESPLFSYFQGACHIPLERSWRGYNFSWDLTWIEGLQTKLWAPKVIGVLILGILELPFGSLETKWHLGAGPMAMHKVYYKGKGGGFPKVRAVISLMSLCLPVARPCTKMLQLRTKQHVWFVQVCVSNWIACQSSYSHPGTLAHPFTPKVLWAKERAPIPPSILHFWTHRWVHQGAWGCVVEASNLGSRPNNKKYGKKNVNEAYCLNLYPMANQPW